MTETTLLDTVLVILIVVTLLLIIWSRIMKQTMLDTLRELKLYIDDWRQPVDGY
jgi:hypothetical protein